MIKKVAVCVTKQKTCERLIKRGSKISGKNGELYVLHITGKELAALDCDVLQHLFDVSKKYKAQMSVIHSNDVLESITDFINENGINTIVLGESLEVSDKNDMTFKISDNLPSSVKPVVVPVEYNYWDQDVV